MDKKTSGAWIIHHTYKLQDVHIVSPDYEQISFAGKCGITLNALTRSEETTLQNEQVEAYAKANGISIRLELPSILDELHKERLIDRGNSGIAILGLTSAQVLENTAEIFDNALPGPSEHASIDIAELASDLPMIKENAFEYISDTYRTDKLATGEILRQCEEIGFFDIENSLGKMVYFNGNLFRKEDMPKANAILESLNPGDQRRVVELTEKLKGQGCIQKKEAVAVLGTSLYEKVCAIGFLDENSIGNETGIYSFVTRPAAFSKFSNSSVDDAFDLAKAFVTSLTFGMTISRPGRGKITMIKALMQKLIDGNWVGPATAIGHDYKVLELRGVVEVKPTGNGLFLMRLLKREIGVLALKVISEGEASSESLLELPGVSATKYNRPEINRTIIRKKLTEPLKQGMGEMLNAIRTGGLR